MLPLFKFRVKCRRRGLRVEYHSHSGGRLGSQTAWVRILVVPLPSWRAVGKLFSPSVPRVLPHLSNGDTTAPPPPPPRGIRISTSAESTVPDTQDISATASMTPPDPAFSATAPHFTPTPSPSHFREAHLLVLSQILKSTRASRCPLPPPPPTCPSSGRHHILTSACACSGPRGPVPQRGQGFLLTARLITALLPHPTFSRLNTKAPG